MPLTFVKANPADIPLLTETAHASKNAWNYPAEWMELWKEELTMTEERISKNEVVKAFDDGQFIGFYELMDLGGKRWDVYGFWIVPTHLRKGYGKMLFGHMMNFLRQRKAEKLELAADPNANGFYEKMGGEKIGKYASEPEGRELDIYEYDVV